MKTRKPAAFEAAESHEIAKQIEVELALLVNIEQSLRIALDWKTESRGSRKLSTLRFVAQSFDRHLSRLRVLSAYGGYMHLVTDTRPHLVNSVDALKKLRDDLQARMEQLTVRLEHVAPGDSATFDGVCAELERYLEDLKAHGQQEMDLFQHSIAQEEGGSG